jgi:hypothetical protein
MTPDSTMDHAALRRRIPALVAGVLDEDVAASVRAHLESCAECRALHARMLEEDELADPTSEHLPATLVFDWQRKLASYGPLERDLVRAHLDGCTICQDGLVAMGIEPVVPGAGLARGVLPQPSVIHPEAGADLEPSADTGRIVPIGGRRPGWTRRDRWLAGFGSLSTALAATLLVMRIAGTTHAPVPGVATPPGTGTSPTGPVVGGPPSPAPNTGPPGSGTTPTPAPSPPVIEIAASALELEATMRGSGAAVEVVTLPAASRVLRIKLEALVGVEDAGRVRVTLTTPRKQKLRLETRQSELVRGAELRYAPPSGAPPAGRYTLELAPSHAAADSLAPGAVEYEFDVRYSPSAR